MWHLCSSGMRSNFVGTSRIAGGNAHAHVRSCRLNPKQNEYFVSEAEWAHIMDGHRREKLRTYWSSIEPEVTDVLATDASRNGIFPDLRLDKLLDAGAFAA